MSTPKLHPTTDDYLPDIHAAAKTLHQTGMRLMRDGRPGTGQFECAVATSLSSVADIHAHLDGECEWDGGQWPCLDVAAAHRIAELVNVGMAEVSTYEREQPVREKIAAELHRADLPQFQPGEDPNLAARTVRAVDTRIAEHGDSADYARPESGDRS